MGYSLGGRIAALYASRYPENVSALILESAGLGPKNDDARTARAEKQRASSLNLIVRLRSIQHIRWLLFLIIGKRCRSSPRKLSSQRQRVRAFVKSVQQNDPLALRANLSDAGQHKMDDLRPVLATPQ